MYPYFQKTTSLHTAENADPLRQFLAKNPSFGTLIFQVTGGKGSFPITDATIVLTKPLSDQQNLSFTVKTDVSGKTPPLSLPAPDRTLSQKPGNQEVFSIYGATISADGYVPVRIENLPIFDGITTIQPVTLSPDFGQDNKPPQEIDDKAPDL